jgi:hypothetical protein
MNKTKKEKEFIEWIKSECRKKGVKLTLKRTKSVRATDNIRCAGFFTEQNEDGVPELACSMSRPDSIEVLAHEFCHFLQWVEGSEIWNNTDPSSDKLEKWLNGRRVNNIKKHIGVVRDLELDCEKRTVKLLKKWDIGVDLDMYTKKANAYVQFYNYLYYTRRWSNPKNSPYRNGNVIKVMSPKFNMKYEEMSKRVKKVFEVENI